MCIRDRDKTFGYHSSNLKEYVEEKTKGAYKASNVIDISLEELRGLEYDKIIEKLASVQNFGKIVVNAVDAVSYTHLNNKIIWLNLYKRTGD